MKIQKTRRVMADTEVAEEAEDLLFEAEDVADILSQATGEDVDVTAEGATVTFDVGEESFTCEADSDSADVVETSTRANRRRRVSASTNRRHSTGRTVRRRSR